MKLSEITKRGRNAALLWDECDEALASVNETFGEPFESARDTLNASLLSAASSEIDFETFKGNNNPLRFEDLKIMVIVRPSVLPVPDKRLDILNVRIEKAEETLKLLKAERKSLIEKLKIKGHEFVTEKVITAFRRIK
jgi:hypothetical protein|tara:strand:- start:90 stop:503 length:414 start_codon:yes stop_codon:yes gene_type:complete